MNKFGDNKAKRFALLWISTFILWVLYGIIQTIVSNTYDEKAINLYFIVFILWLLVGLGFSIVEVLRIN